MDDFLTGLSRFNNPFSATNLASTEKKIEVATTAAAKKAQLAGPDALTVPEVNMVYGPDAGSIFQSDAIANSIDRSQRFAARTEQEAQLDAYKGVANGFISSTLGIGALGLGLVNSQAGGWAAQKVGDLNQYIQSNQSAGLNARRQAYGRDTEAAYAENKARSDAAGGGWFNTLKRIGNDAVDSVKIATGDSAILSDGVAQGVGSIVVGGPLSSSIKSIGNAVLKGATLARPSLLLSEAAGKAASLGSKAAMPASIGLMEAGGTYQQTYTEALDRLKGRTDISEDRKIQLANQAALEAAAIQFPLAAATGILTSKFEANPFKVGSLPAAAGNLLKEAVEEGIQSGSSQFATNRALKDKVDGRTDLADGIGDQIGTGALYGLGTAGVVQAPGAVLRTGIDTAKMVKDGVISAIGGRMDGITKARTNASPTSDLNLSATNDALVTQAPVQAETVASALSQKDMAPEVKASVADNFSQVQRAFNLDPAEVEAASTQSPVMADIFDGATNRFATLSKAAEVVQDTKRDPMDRIEAAAYLDQHIRDTKGRINDLAEPLADEDPAVNVLQGYADHIAGIESNKGIQSAYAELIPLMQKITASDVQDNAANAQKVGELAVKAPESIDPEVAKIIAYQHDSGKIQLTPTARNTLEMVDTVDTAQRKATEEAAPRLRQTDRERVADEIRYADGPNSRGGFSIWGHLKNIVEATSQGDMAQAKVYLDDLMAFNQSMQNKVAALNQSWDIPAGQDNKVAYQAYNPRTRTWFDTKTAGGAFVNQGVANSVDLANQINTEAGYLNEVANRAAQIMGIGVQPVERVTLRPEAVERQVMNFERLQKAEKATRRDAVTEVPATKRPAEATMKNQERVTVPVSQSATERTDQPQSSRTEQSQAQDRTKNEPEQARQVETKSPSEAVASKETQSEAEVSPTETVSTKAEVSQEKEAQAVPQSETADQNVEQTEASETPVVGVDDNSLFAEAFGKPETTVSRLADKPDGLTWVRDSLSTKEKLASVLGSDTAGRKLREPVAKAYQEYLGKADGIIKAMNTALQDHLKKPMNKDMTFEQALESDVGANVLRFPRNRALGILKDGAYDPVLLGQAVTAGMQWLLHGESRAPLMDGEQLAKVLGVDETIAETYADQFNDGVPYSTAVAQLGQMISDFWGTKGLKDAGIGITRGVPEGLAKEMVNAMAKEGLVKIPTPIKVEGINKTFKQIQFDLTTKLGKDMMEKLDLYPDAIQEAVLPDAEKAVSIGEPIEQVKAKQLRQSMADTTPEQRKMLLNEQSTPFFLNRPFVRLLRAMGETGSLNAFGYVIDENLPLNDKYRETLESRNKQVTSAWKSIMNLDDQMAAYVDGTGDSVDETPIYYPYSITSVNRAQIDTRYNPQSNKLAREAIMPTWSELDMSKPKDYNGFMLAVAQALGIKINKKSVAQNIAQIENDLKTKYADALELVRDLNSTEGDASLVDKLTPETVMRLRRLMDPAKLGPLSPASIMALSEYGRYLDEVDNGDPMSFRTPMYLEADGITDGPINALWHFAKGNFTADWLRNIAKGGGFVGRLNQTINDWSDKLDLYQTMIDDFTKRKAQSDAALSNEGASDHVNALNLLVRTLLPGMIEGNDADGNPIYHRNFVKNPLTVNTYGASPTAIATKMTRQLVDALYERESELMVAMADNPKASPAELMFPQSADPKADYAQYRAAFNLLTNTSLARTRNGMVVREDQDTKAKAPLKPDFELSSKAMSNLAKNMQAVFVGPMIESMGTVMGETTDVIGTMKMATQIHSTVLEHRFWSAVDKALAKKAENNKDFRRSEFLSQNELNKIVADLKHLSPMLETGTQNMLFAANERGDTGIEFSRDLSEQNSTTGQIPSMTNAGVRVVPLLTIGSGDGQMMQNASVQPDAAKGTLKIYDGMHMKISTLSEDSQKINKAVYDAWMMNPLGSLSEMYSNFIGDTNWDFLNDPSFTLSGDKISPRIASQMMSFARVVYDSPREYAVLRDLVNSPDKAVSAKDKAKLAEIEKVIKSSIQAAAEQAGSDLARYAEQQAVRKQVIQEVGMSVDHMAGAGSSFSIKGKVDIDQAKLLDHMQARYDELMAQKTKADTNTDKLPADLANLGTEHPTGVRIVGASQMVDLLRQNTDGELRPLLTAAIKALKAGDYEVVLGSKDQVQAYAKDVGGLVPDREAKGATIPSEKRIYVSSNSKETVLHELIHAVTLDKLLSHYADPTNSENAETVDRLERLMNEWMGNLDFIDLLNDNVKRAAQTAVYQIQKALSAGQPALALNEFMSWNLSNQDLIRTGKRITVMDKLARIGREVLASIKALLFGKQNPKVGEDMFSNLRFNTMAVMLSGTTGSTNEIAPVIAYQMSEETLGARVNSTINSIYQSYINNTSAADRTLAKTAWYNLVSESRSLADTVAANGYDLNGATYTQFVRLSALMKSDVAIKSPALNKAQEIYEDFITNLSVEKLEKVGNTPAQAKLKYDLLTGNIGQEIDNAGLSNLLPSFLALTATSQEFRNELAQIDLVREEAPTEQSFDERLTNAANAVMDWSDRQLNGLSGKESTVGEAMNSLMETMFAEDASQNSWAGLLEGTSNKVDGILDRMNQGVSRVMGDVAAKIEGKAVDVIANTDSKWVQGLAQAVRVAAGVVDPDAAERLGEDARRAFYDAKGYRPLQEMLAEMLGRTQSNAGQFDLIKRIRQTVDNIRQQYRDYLPGVFAEGFTRKLDKNEWGHLHTGLAKTDIASLMDYMPVKDVMGLLKATKSQLAREVRQAKDAAMKAGASSQMITQATELAEYMATGKVPSKLIRNPYAIGFLATNSEPSNSVVEALDKLVSIQSLSMVDDATKQTLENLTESNENGISKLVHYLKGQRNSEKAMALSTEQKLNMYKGYIPTMPKEGMSLVVRNDSQYADLARLGYTRMADYDANLSRAMGGRFGYYLAPINDKNTYLQGMMRTVHDTVGGINAITLQSVVPTAATVDDPKLVNQLSNTTSKGAEQAMPVFNSAGEVIRYELSFSPEMRAHLQESNHIGEMIGVWHGRQIEETMAHQMNQALVDEMAKAYNNATTKEKGEYINVLDPDADIDPVLKDTLRLIPYSMRDMLDAAFGRDTFWVRQDMLNNALGYRKASVRDMWTGNSRTDKEFQKFVSDSATLAFGDKAFQYAAKAEQFVMKRVADAKLIIVVKSMVVPMANFASAMLQLKARGVPTAAVLKGIPAKLGEISSYTKGRLKKMDLETQIQSANGDPAMVQRLQTQIRVMEDGWRRMSIWPLLEAGEFSSITDTALSNDEVALAEGRFADYVERLADKLPDGLRTAARYGMVTKDTALFKGLHRSVQYGDFIAKAIMYDHLRNQKVSKEDALGVVTEEFVNFEYIPGRTASYWDDMGLRWFWHFKLRSAKVGLSMMRNSPVTSLLATFMPTLPVVGSIGTPVDDSIMSQIFDGKAGNSLGWATGWRALHLQPWVNMFS